MIIGPVSKHGNSLNSNVCLGTLSHCIDFTSVHLSQSGLVGFSVSGQKGCDHLV